MKIAKKIYLLFLIAMAVISIPSSCYVYKTIKDNYIRELNSTLKTVLAADTDHIKTYLKMLKSSVLQSSTRITLNDLLNVKDKNSPDYMKAFKIATTSIKLAQKISPAIFEYMLLDIKGIVVASSNGKEIGSDKASDAYFIEGLKGIYIKDIYYSKTYKEILMAVSAPVLDRNTGKLLGVFVARVKPDDLYSIVAHSLGNLSEKCEIYIVNKAGFIITPSKFIMDATLKKSVNVGLIKAISEYDENGKYIISDAFNVYPNYCGISVIGIKTPILETGWTVVIEIDEKGALEYLNKIKFSVALALIIVIIFFWIVSVLIARIIVTPLEKLTKITSIIGEGNLDCKVDIKTNDEIGQLSRSFEKMMLNLKKTTTSIDSLEKEIAERKEVEIALKGERVFTDSTINSIPGIFYILDESGHFLRWNRNLEIVSEYSAEEIKKINILDLFSEEEKKLVGETINKGLASGHFEVEANLVSKNGSRVTYYFTGHILMLGKTPYLVGMGIDITKRKKIELDLNQSEERQRILYESSADAIMTLEPPLWRFTAGNLSTIKMFMARDEAEFLSKTPHVLSPEYQPDGRLSSEKALEMINTAMKSGSHSFEWTHKRINGEDFPATVLLTKVSLRDKEFLQATVRDITELALKEKRLKEQNVLLEHIATHDNLTQIANRGAFTKFANLIFQTSKRHNHNFAVLEIDVDNFKEVNDQYGHDMGDLVLQAVTLTIKQEIRAGDILARLGGDEFGLIFTEVREPENAGFLADKIVKLFSNPLDINGKLIPISVSIGVACYPAEGVDKFDILLKQADIAMYKAKRKGKNCFDVFAS